MAMSTTAQDIIVLRNASQIEARVDEVTDEQIRYRKFNNLDGPVYSVKRTEVFIVRYENGTREVITPLQTAQEPSADAGTDEKSVNNTAEDKYAHINEAQNRAKQELHKKKFYFTVQPNFGGAICYGGDADFSASGLYTGFDIIGELFPNKVSSNGMMFGFGYNYRRYNLSILEQHVNFNAFDINVGYSYRSDHQKFYARGFLNINIPLSAQIPGYYFTNDQSIDMMEITNTTVGYILDAGVHFGGFNIGGRIGLAFNRQFEGCASAMVIGVNVGYTF